MDRSKRYGWLISEGKFAKRDRYWCAKVLRGEFLLEDFTFAAPRKVGQNTPEQISYNSENRRGRNNPSLNNRPIYDIIEMRDFSLSLFDQLAEDPRKFKKLEKALRDKFPNYGFSFVEMFPKNGDRRGDNRQNAIISFLINRTIDWVIKQKRQDRGKLISIGQLRSPNLINMANAGRKTLKSHKSQPHLVLLNMVLSLDPDAIKEKHVDYKHTWKSYDIFSPSKNILIEMHGRIWHDLQRCAEKLIPLVTENVENDKIKEKLAKDRGYRLFIFWDDETDKWESELKKIYGKSPKKYEQAHREETDKKAKCGSL